ncbi:unnamed protein product [Boreogadus saida]
MMHFTPTTASVHNPPRILCGARTQRQPRSHLPDPVDGAAEEGSTATVIPKERPRRMADLFGKIMGKAAAIKGIPMPAPPLAPMSDDMQGECFLPPFLIHM